MNQFDFDTRMKWGDEHVNAGRLHAAASMYERAATNATNPSERVQAAQKLGIVLRLGGDFELSEVYLKQAYQAAPDTLLRARVARDLAMTLMENLLPRRQDYFDRIVDLLEESREAFTRDSPEYWATVGFAGRAELLFGNRCEAHALMLQADREFRQLRTPHPTYELNNLIWLLRTVSVQKRLVHLPRAVSLIRQTGQTRRYKELAPIMLGGDWLYRVVRRAAGK